MIKRIPEGRAGPKTPYLVDIVFPHCFSVVVNANNWMLPIVKDIELKCVLQRSLARETFDSIGEKRHQKTNVLFFSISLRCSFSRKLSPLAIIALP